MPPALLYFSRTWSAALAAERPRLSLGILGLLHFAAFAMLLWTEGEIDSRLVFFFTWTFLNCAILLLVRRPTVAASLSLIVFVVLIYLSRFKQDVLIMTANFIDLWLIDESTVSFLLTVFPQLRWIVAVAVLIIGPLLTLLWWVDPFRLR